MLYMKFGKNRLHGFRGDVWKCWRTTDGRQMPAYTISSPMSLLLRWANKTGQCLPWCNCYILLFCTTNSFLTVNFHNFIIIIYGNGGTGWKERDTSSINLFEPPHDKTNKMTLHPAKTQTDQPVHPHSLISLHCELNPFFMGRTFTPYFPVFTMSLGETLATRRHFMCFDFKMRLLDARLFTDLPMCCDEKSDPNSNKMVNFGKI